MCPELRPKGEVVRPRVGAFLLRPRPSRRRRTLFVRQCASERTSVGLPKSFAEEEVNGTELTIGRKT